MNKGINALKQWLKNIKIEYVIAIVAVVAVLVIFFGNFNQNSSSTAKKNK